MPTKRMAHRAQSHPEQSDHSDLEHRVQDPNPAMDNQDDAQPNDSNESDSSADINRQVQIEQQKFEKLQRRKDKQRRLDDLRKQTSELSMEGTSMKTIGSPMVHPGHTYTQGPNGQEAHKRKSSTQGDPRPHKALKVTPVRDFHGNSKKDHAAWIRQCKIIFRLNADSF